MKRLIVVVGILLLAFTIGCSALKGGKGKNEVNSNFSSFIDKEYLEYKDNRPEFDKVELSSEFWTMIPGFDQGKVDKLNKKLDYLSMLYKLSTIYTDAYFNNSELHEFQKKKSEEWQQFVKTNDFEGISAEEYVTKANIFADNATKEQEFLDIVVRGKKAKENYKQRAKELGQEALLSAIKELIDLNALTKITPPAAMGWKEKLSFASMMKKEPAKASTIISQATALTEGTSLVAGHVIGTVTIKTFEISGFIVTVAVEASGKIIMTAVTATGETVDLVIRGGSLVVAQTGEVITDMGSFTVAAGMGISHKIGDLSLRSMKETELTDQAKSS